MKLHNPFLAAEDNNQSLLFCLYIIITIVLLFIIMTAIVHLFSPVNAGVTLLLFGFARMLYAVFTGK